MAPKTERGLTITVPEGVQSLVGGQLLTIWRARGNHFRVNAVSCGPLPLPSPIDADVDPYKEENTSTVCH